MAVQVGFLLVHLPTSWGASLNSLLFRSADGDAYHQNRHHPANRHTYHLSLVNFLKISGIVVAFIDSISTNFRDFTMESVVVLYV